MIRNLNMQRVDGRGRGRATARLVALVRVLLAVFVFAAAAPKAAAQEDMPLDYQVKAAFLVNFPKYVDFPTASFTGTNTPIQVAIFGDDNVADEFATMISGGRAVGGRTIVLRRISKEEEITPDIQILFIGSSERHRTAAILEKLKAANVLTVGESEDFLNRGGVVNLNRQGRKIRLQVNLEAANQAQLRISSKLLMASDVVKGKAK